MPLRCIEKAIHPTNDMLIVFAHVILDASAGVMRRMLEDGTNVIGHMVLIMWSIASKENCERDRL